MSHSFSPRNYVSFLQFNPVLRRSSCGVPSGFVSFCLTCRYFESMNDHGHLSEASMFYSILKFSFLVLQHLSFLFNPLLLYLASDVPCFSVLADPPYLFLLIFMSGPCRCVPEVRIDQILVFVNRVVFFWSSNITDDVPKAAVDPSHQFMPCHQLGFQSCIIKLGCNWKLNR